MSRCFPFPPPGYVKKGTTNDVDLLKKEKHREKKHKKEKKEKRKKGKSEGNDREKKEKRGEKDKEKDGDKVKYKNSITFGDEKKLAWKPVVHTGEILGLNGFSKTPGKVFGNSEDTRNQDNHHLVKDTEASKYVQDLGSKVINGNTMLPIFPGIFDGKTHLICKSIGSKAEGKTKTAKKEREDKHREKKSKGEDKNSENKKKKKDDEKTREQDNPKVEKNGVKDVDMASDIQGHLRKRKDFGDFLGSGQVPDGGAHGHLHPDADIKLPCILSSHSMVQNGKVMDPWHLVVDDEKKLKVNGIMIEGKPVTTSLTSKPVPITTSKITPHPDTKYLEEVLSVPKMEEWSEYDDDHEWLKSETTWLKKPRIENNESPRVWDKAVLIDSAEVYALPYVIPY